jgi:hypothetical protein
MQTKSHSHGINDPFELADILGLEKSVGEQLITFCQRNDIAYLGLFGSFSRGEQTKGSDIDFLVRFSETKSLIDHIRMEEELEDLLGIKVDLVTEKSLSPYITPHVQENMKGLYCEE